MIDWISSNWKSKAFLLKIRPYLAGYLGPEGLLRPSITCADLVLYSPWGISEFYSRNLRYLVLYSPWGKSEFYSWNTELPCLVFTLGRNPNFTTWILSYHVLHLPWWKIRTLLPKYWITLCCIPLKGELHCPVFTLRKSELYSRNTKLHCVVFPLRKIRTLLPKYWITLCCIPPKGELPCPEFTQRELRAVLPKY